MQAYALLAFSMAGSLIAFLIFNHHPAKIFMGDSGSLMIGLVNAILVIKFINVANTPFVTVPVRFCSCYWFCHTDCSACWIHFGFSLSGFSMEVHLLHRIVTMFIIYCLTGGWVMRLLHLPVWCINIGYLVALAIWPESSGSTITFCLLCSHSHLPVLVLLYYGKTTPYHGYCQKDRWNYELKTTSKVVTLTQAEAACCRQKLIQSINIYFCILKILFKDLPAFFEYTSFISFAIQSSFENK